MSRVKRNTTHRTANGRRHIHNVLRDVALAIGGVFYSYPVPDEAVWATARSLDKIFRRALEAQAEQAPRTEAVPPHSRGRKHPAIVELLRRLEAHQNPVSEGAKIVSR